MPESAISTKDPETSSGPGRAGDGATTSTTSLALVTLFAGTFAVGTDGFMIAGLLPQIARSFSATTAAAAQLVTVFAFTYALGAPVMASLLARAGRRTVLVTALCGLSAMNALAALAPVLWLLFLARVAAALAACTYTPAAAVMAAGLAGNGRRGRALGVVTIGLTLSIVTGVPLGALAGGGFGWRATFAGVAVLSAAVAATARALLPETGPAGPAAAIGERVAAVRTPGVPRVLVTTLLGILAGYLGYTFAGLVSHAAGARGSGALAVILACFGAGAACGALLSGAGSDRYGQPLAVRAGAIAQAAALAALAVMDAVGAHAGVAPVAAAYGLLGAGSFAYNAPQQHRLIELAPASATTLVSLNSSAIYAGIALSGAIGGLTIQAGPALDCLTGALIAAATVAVAGNRRGDGGRGGKRSILPTTDLRTTNGRTSDAHLRGWRYRGHRDTSGAVAGHRRPHGGGNDADTGEDRPAGGARG